MSDELVRVHLKKPDLLVVGVLCTQTARKAREIHGCLPTSAALLAEALTAGFGVAGLLAGQARINLQLTCDGPAQGAFVDADAEGGGRGYLKNPQVNFLGAGCGPFDASSALGREGVLSVIRELKPGEFYRGAVTLEHLDLARDLERFYRESDQLETTLDLSVEPDGEERLGRVCGLFVQAMPDAAPGAARAARERVDLARVQGEHAFDLVRPLAEALGGELDVLGQYPLDYVCHCSAEKVMRAVVAMGREELEDLLQREGRAVAHCAFCHKTYEVGAEQLQQMIAAHRQREAEGQGGGKAN